MTSSDCTKPNAKLRQEAEKRVKSILSKYKKVGLKDSDIAALVLSKFTQKSVTGVKLKVFVLIAILISCVFFYFMYSFGDDERCWFSMPGMVTKATRPPERCSMCSDVSSVRRLTNLTPDIFEDEYAYNGIPIVVTDATQSWGALKIFDFWFFKKVYTETDIGSAARDCQFFPYKTEFNSLYDALQMNHERANLTHGSKPWYIGWSNCHDSVARILRLHYSRPYFLPESAENNAVDWIFMGGPGDGAQMHVDNVVHPSWQAQLKGRKRWILSPPPECYYSCKSLEVIVQPGEIIVLDTNRWYHKTEVMLGEISITIGAEYD